MKKLKKRRAQPDRDRMFLTVAVVFITIVLLTIMNARISRIYRESPVVSNHNVTPILHPTDKPGWKTFVHPEYKFTFSYPEAWRVTLVKSDVRDRGYNLILTYDVGRKPYRVQFMRGGRGGIAYDSIQRDTVSFGPHTGYINTYVKDKVPVEQIITFRDSNLIKPYIAIEAQLPGVNSKHYVDQLLTIASTIKRTE